MISVPVIKNTPEIFPFPIFDSIEYYHSESWLDGPIRSNATRILTRIINSTHELSKDWSPIYLQLADRFLCKHLGQANTFNRFKNEIERFTLWLAIEHKKNPMELDSNDINDFLEFLETPKKTWVSAYNSPRVTSNDDKVILNTDWRPIRARRPKGVKLPPLNSSDPLLRELRHQSDRELINSYSPKISSIAASIRALRPFYNYLIHQQKMTEKGFRETGDNSGLISTEMNISNPISEASKRFRKKHLVPNDELINSTHNRLTRLQWNLIIEALISLKDSPSTTEFQRKKWIRALFIITFMKANMLRISEICKSRAFNPKMSDIKKNTSVENMDYWEYSFIANGNTKRKVVIPDALLTYLIDYRRSRGLVGDYPNESEQAPLVAQLKADLDEKGNVIKESSLSYSATRDQIEFALNKAAEYIELKAKELGVNYDKDILAIQQASTFSLRQTGAYMALEDGEDISSVAENLGHVNSRVTAQIHSQQNPENRAKYISRRRVE